MNFESAFLDDLKIQASNYNYLQWNNRLCGLGVSGHALGSLLLHLRPNLKFIKVIYEADWRFPVELMEVTKIRAS